MPQFACRWTRHRPGRIQQRRRSMIVDSHVHAYEANTAKRPWATVPNWPDHVAGDGAIFISSFSMYRYDASYAVEVAKAHPDRMPIVKPFDPEDPNVSDVIAE